MDASAEHPAHETLQAYGLGKLDDALAEVVSKHLEACPDCRHRWPRWRPTLFSAVFGARRRDASRLPQVNQLPQGRRLKKPWPMTPLLIAYRLRACLPQAKSTRHLTL